MAEKGLHEQDICRMGSPEANSSLQRSSEGERERVQTRSDRVRKFLESIRECFKQSLSIVTITGQSIVLAVDCARLGLLFEPRIV